MLNHTNLRRSFRSAGRGFRVAFLEEQNFRIQIGIAACALFGGVVFQLQQLEWIALFLGMSMVLAAEIINSAFERILDSMKPRISVYIGSIKDLMSAAVLITATMALGVGVLLFLPRIIDIVISLFG